MIATVVKQNELEGDNGSVSLENLEITSAQDITNDMDFVYSTDDVGRNRINIIRESSSYKVTVRILRDEILSPEALGIPDVLRQKIKEKNGIILITGPTGSGKSTTMASLIEEINKTMAKSVTTLEDPIEYVYENKQSIITQREAGTHTSFSKGLRATLRQDPDIILIGEMRDRETVETALTASETGHLVISTLHTNSAVSTINRIIDLFPIEYKSKIASQLSQSLRIIFTQSLLPSKKNGRVLGYEILVPDNAIRRQINELETTKIRQSMPSAKGSVLWNDCLKELRLRGFITNDELTANLRDD